MIDEEDCESVMNSGNTRMQKVSRVLDLIKRKGRSGMKHFVDALEFEHPELYKTFTGRDASAGNSDFFLETVKVRYSTELILFSLVLYFI